MSKTANFKLLIFIFSFIFISFNIYSQQNILAGDTLSKYVDVNPDSFLLAGLCSNNCTEESYLDINDDSIFDIKFFSFGQETHFTHVSTLYISALNGNTFFRLIRMDSVQRVIDTAGNFVWDVVKVADPLLLGEVINGQNALWDSSVSTKYSSIEYDFSHQVIWSQIISDWDSNTTDKYLGVKYLTATDTIYGWIRIYLGGLLKDYSFNSELIGIAELENNFKIYPNPSTGKVFIEQPDPSNYEVKVFNLDGRLIYQSVNFNSNKSEIDIDTNSSGIYFLRIITVKGIINKKILVFK